MIITKEEFLEMGFSLGGNDEETLESCIKRAEFVLNGLTNDRAGNMALGTDAAAELVKQAAAFQTAELLKRGSSADSSSGERVAVGDFSYYKTSSRTSSASDDSATVIRLLRAAGCLYGGTEVRE
ncbi:MAG: hypothetical protein NC299_12070 [Lachnospiraceae bacterium]|nr:hypothetical protein [Ruminococcus sp.]MCM1276079.1 hypothetical protein [Lachnospiraceae bacterium]